VRTRFGTITSSERVTLLSVKGLCAQPDRDPEEWFSDRSRGGQSRLRDRREAARLCAGCPVVRECLEYAVGTRQRYGVWGGMSERDRTVLTRATGRRPRPATGAGQPRRRTPIDQPDGQSGVDDTRISA
jgi:WhiB family redox-sensing transcriptional regulator